MPKQVSPAPPTPIYPFDFKEDLKENGFMIVHGTRGRGKTTLVRLFTQLMPWSFTAQFVFFVGTPAVKEQWCAVSHPFYVRDPVEGALEELLQIQQEKVQICQYYNIPFPPEWELVIIVDDCGGYPKFLRGKVVPTFASNGRNEHVTFISLIQKLTQMEPTSRENATTFIGMRTEKVQTVNSVHSDYASSINKERFQAIYSETTSGNKALCINCGADDPSDLLFVTHARMLHPDGHEAIANQKEADIINEKRLKRGKAPRTWEVHNMLKRLGAQIHEDIANQEYRTPSLKELMKSNSLLKMMSRNSLCKSLGDPLPPYDNKASKRVASKTRSKNALERRPSLFQLAVESHVKPNEIKTEVESNNNDGISDTDTSSESDDDGEDESAVSLNPVLSSDVVFHTREDRNRAKIPTHKKKSKKKNKLQQEDK